MSYIFLLSHLCRKAYFRYSYTPVISAPASVAQNLQCPPWICSRAPISMTSDVARFSKTYKLALCYKFFAAGAKNLINLLNLKDCVPLNLKIKYLWFNVKGRPISVDKTYIPRLFFSPDYTFNATSVVYTKVQYCFFFLTI
jgi:hypothetical protein